MTGVLSSEAGVITAIGIVRAKPGREEELGKRMAALIGPTREEPGCIAYDLLRSIDDPAVWILLEKWRSRIDLDEHIRSAHLQAFLRSKDDVLALPPESHRVVGHPGPVYGASP